MKLSENFITVVIVNKMGCANTCNDLVFTVDFTWPMVLKCKKCLLDTDKFLLHEEKLMTSLSY